VKTHHDALASHDGGVGSEHTITRPARTDGKAAKGISLDLASEIVSILDCGIEDLLEVVD
jgi:DNA-binding Xre family transcriptional regulator